METDLDSSDGGNTMGTGTRADSTTRELPVAPAAASEDRCPNCGSPLAHDQRYCVECGERRGQSRFPVAQPATEVRSRRARSARPPGAPRASSGTTLVAGVGVLLLAIGLGVLIGRLGHDNSNQKAAATPAQVITVNGGGSGTSTAAQTTTTHAPAASHRLSGKLKKAATSTAPPSKAVQQKATQAAGKVLGNSKNLPPPTVTTGGSCNNSQSESGCQGGHFTGNFFGQ